MTTAGVARLDAEHVLDDGRHRPVDDSDRADERTSHSFSCGSADGAANANTNDFAMSFRSPADTTPPVRSTGSRPARWRRHDPDALSLTTNENATCRYSTTAGVRLMPSVFSRLAVPLPMTVTGLTNGEPAFSCGADGAANANTNDFAISFSVAQAADTTPPVRSMGLDRHAGGGQHPDDAESDDYRERCAAIRQAPGGTARCRACSRRPAETAH